MIRLIRLSSRAALRLQLGARALSSAPALDADVIVCGAGVAGVSCAYQLSTKHGLSVLLVDERPPLSYTSSMSTECYRNFWADSEPMTRFMNRSIELLEARAAESGNAFAMNKRGYAFLTKRPEQAEAHVAAARLGESIGIGGARIHRGAGHGVRAADVAALGPGADVDGIDVFLGAEAIEEYLPGGWLDPGIVSLMLVRRCGWMNAQQMGAYLLEQARETGRVETLTPAAVTAVSGGGGGGGGADGLAREATVVELSVPGEAATRQLRCGAFVNAAGPFAANVSRMLGPSAVDLRLSSEVHSKVVMKDELRAVPCEEAPMLIWDDEVTLPWTEEEQEMLAAMGPDERRLLGALPPGVHLRPYPGATNSMLMLWEYAHLHQTVSDPPQETPDFLAHLYPEMVVRGMSEMIPAMGGYLEAMPSAPYVDGGYYTKTPDNMPMIGPAVAAGGADAAVPNAFVCAGLSGYGVMAANGAGELLADHVAGAPLPPYAHAFRPERWADAEYVRKVEAGEIGGLQI